MCDIVSDTDVAVFFTLIFRLYQAQITFVLSVLLCIVCSNSLLKLNNDSDSGAVFSTLFTHVKIMQVHDNNAGA